MENSLWLLIFVLLLISMGIGIGILIIKYKKCLSLLNYKVIEYEQNAHVIVDVIADAVVVADMNGCIHRINPAAERMTGVKSASYEGRDVSEIISIFDNYTGKMCGDVIREILADTSLLNKRTILCVNDSKKITVDMRAEVISSIGDRPSWLVLVMKDLTEHQKVNEYLVQVQRLETLELTARACAHDINNMLGGIICMCEVIQMKLDENNEVREYINRIIENSDRAAATVVKLHAIARNNSDFFENTDIHQTLTKLIKSNDVFCSFSLSLNSNNSIVCINPARIELALTNICLNAVEAVRGREGRLSIKTDTVELGVEFCEENKLIPCSGGFISIQISDNGCGMSKELQELIFDPLVTTSNCQAIKIGVGLDTANRIVSENKGCILVESEQGEGSTFTLYLPLQVITD